MASYCRITNVVAPGSAGVGDTVPVDVHEEVIAFVDTVERNGSIRTVATITDTYGNTTTFIDSAYAYGVVVTYETVSGSFVMPNSDVTLHVYTYWAPIRTTDWHGPDDSVVGTISLEVAPPPGFAPGSVHVATCSMTNPTVAAFDYTAELYMGTDLALMASADFHLNAGETKDVSLSITMPYVGGTYPVYVGVFSGGENIALYHATEDVVVGAPAFSYGTPSCQLVHPHPRHLAFADSARLIFSVPITNTGAAQTRVLTIKYREIGGSTRNFVPGTVEPGGGGGPNIIYITLGAGGTTTYSYNSSSDMYQSLLNRIRDYAFWIEDDGGGKSEECLWS